MTFVKHLYKNSVIQIILYTLHFLLIPLIAPLLDIFFNVYGSNEGTAVITISVIFIVIFSTLYISDSTLGLMLTSILYYLLVLLYHTDRTIYGIGDTYMFDFFNDNFDIIFHSVYVLILEVTTSLFTKLFRLILKGYVKQNGC